MSSFFTALHQQKRKKIPLFLYLVTISFLSFSQPQSYQDSLSHRLSMESDDSLKILILRKLAWHNFNKDLDMAEEYTRQFQELSLKHGYKFQEAASYHYFGLLYRFRGNYSEAIQSFRKALDMFKVHGSDLSQTGPIYNLGVIYSFIGDYEKSLEYYLMELELNKKHELPVSVANSLNSIGLVYAHMGEPDKAAEYYQQAIGLLEEEEENDQISNPLTNLAGYYLELNQTEKAERIARRVLAIDQKTKDIWGLAHDFELLAGISLEKDQYAAAENYADQSLEIALENGFARVAGVAYLKKAHIYEAQKRWNNVIEAANSGIAHIGAEGDVRLIKGMEDALKKAYANTRNFELAYEHAIKSQRLSDSIFSEEKLNLTKELEAKYELRQKDLAIANMEREQGLTNKSLAQEKKLNLTLTIASLLLVISLFSSIIAFVIKLRARKKIAAQEAEVKKQKISRLEKEKQLTAINALIDGQEAERSRIARELHDGLGGLLATVKHHFTAVSEKEMQSEQFHLYEKGMDLLSGAVEEVRRISHNMMPYAINKLGLMPAIEDIASGLMAGKKMKVNVQNLGIEEKELSEDLKLVIYRVIQELSNNVSKHADADHLIIQLSSYEGEVLLTVEDDGNGFDPALVKQKEHGIGLNSLRSRIEYLGGSVDIDSEIGEGTSISVSIPSTHMSVAN